MKKTLLWITLLVIVGSMLSACSGASSPSLVGEWKLVSYGSTPALPNVDTSIVFDTDTINGNVGCNGFGGDYNVSGDVITFGQIMSTMMACDEARMSQEGAVFGVFVNKASFNLDGNTLTFTSADGQSFVVLARK